MNTNQPSFISLVSGIGCFLAIWAYSTFAFWGKECCTSHGIGILFGVAGYTLFACSLLLSSRWKVLENWFGGLDQIYHIHRKLGIWGFCAILVHPWIEAIKWLPNRLDKFFLMTFPYHGRVSIDLGSIAYWMMILILGITLLKLLPYDKWKILHKFMSLVFLLASLHFLLSGRRFGSAFSQGLLWVPMAIGFFGILYKQVILAFFMARPGFIVQDVQRLNDNVIELKLAPQDSLINYAPGQYGFFSFDGPFLPSESHPFTMIGSKDGFSLLVKTRGDFTRTLYQQIKKGVRAAFEGPYGRFHYSKGTQSQVWIGGGIGVVPFISWIRSMQGSLPKDMRIDFFYCAHRKCDVLCYEEFQQFESHNPGFHCHLHCTEDQNRLDLDKISQAAGSLKEKSILMCGPLRLTQSFTKQFLAQGVERRRIIFEDFEFF